MKLSVEQWNKIMVKAVYNFDWMSGHNPLELLDCKLNGIEV